MEGREDKGTEMAVSISTPPVPVLEDRLASKPLDLTLKLMFALFRTPCIDSNQLGIDIAMGIDHPILDLGHYHLG